MENVDQTVGIKTLCYIELKMQIQEKFDKHTHLLNFPI